MIEQIIAIFSNINIILLICSLVIFSILCKQSAILRSFQYQMSIAVMVLIGSEIIETLADSEFITSEFIENYFSEDLSHLIHVVAMAGIALIFWYRYVYAEKTRKTLVEHMDD